MPEISLIVPVWDRLDCTSRFVTQCLESTTGDLEVIVVNNGSTDGTKEWLHKTAEKHSNLKCVHNTENQGYPRGLNQGLLTASGEYMVCLNNDISIVFEDWLERLLQPLRENKRQLIGARMIHGNHQVRVDGWTPSYLEGWCHAFHWDFLIDVGFYDEAYSPAFVEDVDICWRADKCGYLVEQHPEFEWWPDGKMVNGLLYHLYGKTTYTPRAQGGHREDTKYWSITPPHVAVFKAKVRSGDFSPFYPQEVSVVWHTQTS